MPSQTKSTKGRSRNRRATPAGSPFVTDEFRKRVRQGMQRRKREDAAQRRSRR